MKLIRKCLTGGASEGFLNSSKYGMVQFGTQLGGGIASLFPTPNADLNQNSLMASLVRDTISNALLASGNPYAMLAGGAVKIFDKTGGFTDMSQGLGGWNDFGNAAMSFLLPGANYFMHNKTDKYKMSDDIIAMSSGYTGAVKKASTALNNAGANLWFGKDLANKQIKEADQRDKTIQGIKRQSDMDFLSMASNTQNKAMSNAYGLRGGYNQGSVKYGEQGMKVEEVFTPTTAELDKEFFDNLFKDEEVEMYKKGNKFKSGDKANTKECAAFSNKVQREAGYMTSGNAWNLNNVDVLYSGYNTDNYPQQYSRQALQAYNNDASDRFFKEFDSKTLDPNKMYAVNMYYNNSPALERAYKEGRDKMTGTHTGFVSWNPEKNMWEVTHNIHGTIHVDPFTAIQGGGKLYGITGIYSLRKNNLWNNMKGLLGRIFEEGGTLECFEPSVESFKEGGLMNVIPEGSLHARLHHMENADNLTKKGIPVVDNQGNQLAEIEHSEIIFTKEVTEKLEELCNKFNSDEYTAKEKEGFAIEAGKLLSKEIIENTDDRVGLLNDNQNETLANN